MYIQDTGYVSFHGRYAKITQRSFKLINHFIQAHKSLFLEMSVVGEKLPETQGVKCPELVHGRKFPVGSPMDWEDPTHDYVFAIKGNDGEAGTEYWIRSKGGMLTDPRDVPPDWVDIDELYRFWDPPRPLVDGGWEGPDNQPRRLDSLPIWWPMDSSQRQRKRRYEEEKENMKTKKMNIKGLRCRGLGPSVGEDVGSNFGFVDQLNKINPDIGEDAEQESHEEAFVREYIAYTAVVEPAHVVNAVDVNPSDLQSIENIIKQVVHVSHKKAIAYADAHLRDTFVGELVDRICGVLDGDAFDLSDRCKLERYVRRFTPENGMQVALIIALGQAEKPPDGGNLGANKAGQFVSALIAAVGRA